MNDSLQQLHWGIIRYAPNTGAFPDEDLASFDGWYASRDDAEMIYRDWIDQFPNWVGAIVKADNIHLSEDIYDFEHLPAVGEEEDKHP